MHLLINSTIEEMWLIGVLAWIYSSLQEPNLFGLRRSALLSSISFVWLLWLDPLIHWEALEMILRMEFLRNWQIPKTISYGRFSSISWSFSTFLFFVVSSPLFLQDLTFISLVFFTSFWDMCQALKHIGKAECAF